jgi:hypothetical protein
MKEDGRDMDEVRIYNRLLSTQEIRILSDVVGIEEQLAQIPKSYTLYQNYPNPFNPSTNIEFQIPKSKFVTLKIINILGEEVATLVSDRLTAGGYSYEWSRPAGIASGVYLYRLEAGDYIKIRKMIFMK